MLTEGTNQPTNHRLLNLFTLFKTS